MGWVWGLVGFGMWDLASSHWVPISSGIGAWFSSDRWGKIQQVNRVRCRSGHMISAQKVCTLPSGSAGEWEIAHHEQG